MSENGALAVALAKAQRDFATVKRDKKVTVQTKTGGSYSFNYAPLDSILEAVRKPLADNGLVVVQLLDDGDLVTMLIHESGAQISGSVALPSSNEIQAFGSAITYLRRYAIQALLGIAAEDDDDGNRAVGNVVRPRDKQPVEAPQIAQDGLIGTVEKGKPPVDMEPRQTPNGLAWGFKLKDGSRSFQVLATGSLADVLSMVEDLTGQRVQVFGTIEMIPWDKAGKAMPPYARVHMSRIVTPDFILPSETDGVEPTEAATAPLFDDLDHLGEDEAGGDMGAK